MSTKIRGRLCVLPYTSSPHPTTLDRSLQNDINAEKTRREEIVRAREELQGQVAELGGLVKSTERMLQLEKVRGGWAKAP